MGKIIIIFFKETAVNFSSASMDCSQFFHDKENLKKHETRAHSLPRITVSYNLARKHTLRSSSILFPITMTACVVSCSSALRDVNQAFCWDKNHVVLLTCFGEGRRWRWEGTVCYPQCHSALLGSPILPLQKKKNLPLISLGCLFSCSSHSFVVWFLSTVSVSIAWSRRDHSTTREATNSPARFLLNKSNR